MTSYISVTIHGAMWRSARRLAQRFEVNKPRVLEELEREFARYERALCSNDVKAHATWRSTTHSYMIYIFYIYELRYTHLL